MTYEELTSSPGFAVKLGASRIKKSHDGILAKLAAVVLEPGASRSPRVAHTTPSTVTNKKEQVKEQVNLGRGEENSLFFLI